MKAATAVRTLAMFAAVGAGSLAAAAAAGEIRVYCSGAPAAAAKAIAADFAKATGHQMTFTIAQPATIQHDLGDGGRADVVILPAPVIAKLTGSRMLRAGSAVALARVGVGVVVRADAPVPDIADAAAIRKLLLDARSIVYPDPATGGGSAGRAVARMIDRLGVANAVAPKLARVHAIGGGVELVANGQAEVGFFIISEIMPVKGVTLVGPLPDALQSKIVFSAAIASAAPAPELAAAFIERLADPASRQAWRDAGFEPLAGKPTQ